MRTEICTTGLLVLILLEETNLDVQKASVFLNCMQEETMRETEDDS
jgi:hypothetical protein